MYGERESEALVAQLADTLEHAPTVPIFRSQVRVNSREIYRLVDLLKESVRADEAAGKVKAPQALNALLAGDDGRDAIYNAPPVPLSDQVRLPRTRVTELVRSLRTAL